jgi:uncharacterized protein YPO0396
MLNESNSIDEFIIKLAEKEGIDISDITEQEKNIVKSIYDEYKEGKFRNRLNIERKEYLEKHNFKKYAEDLIKLLGL